MMPRHGVLTTLALRSHQCALSPPGWTMRGFVGTMSELNARLLYGDSSLEGVELGFAAKLLKDSGAEAATKQTQSFLETVEKTQRELQQSVEKTQRGWQETVERTQREAADAVRQFTGRSSYHFGDLTRATWERLTGAEKEPE